jgi:hypothetical protein
VDYLSKVESSNVRGVGNFFVICSNLGQYFQYNLYGHFPRNLNQKLYPSNIVWNFLISFLRFTCTMGVSGYSNFFYFFFYTLRPRRSRYASCYDGRSTGGIWYFDIPSPNTIFNTVFSVLLPPTCIIALWGSLVLPLIMLV